MGAGKIDAAPALWHRGDSVRPLTPPDRARKGPVAVLSRHRGRLARLVAMLERERFEVAVAGGVAELAALLDARAPTALVIDWPDDEEPARAEVIHAARVRAERPSIVVVADGAEAEALRASPAVRAVVGAALEVEEVVDAVWRAHHEAVDARRARAVTRGASSQGSGDGSARG